MPFTPALIANPQLAYGLPDPFNVPLSPSEPPGSAAGVELGRAQLDTTNALTATLTAIVGFAVPCVVPAGVGIFVEADFPWITMGATSTFAAVQLFEDTTQLKYAISPAIAANGQTSLRVAQSYVPLVSGAHTYLVKAAVGVASAGATIQGGVVAGLLLSAVLRVVTC